MTLSGSTTVAANTRSSNVVAGQQFEFVPYRSMVQLRVSSSADTILLDFQIGAVTIVSTALAPNSNRFPIIPDDVLAQAAALPGERLFLTFSNTTAGALTVKWALDIMPY